jgi:aspartyl-tRNA(Asn)/glutamyl-tRNA(Gln) amidotransferase subunit C
MGDIPAGIEEASQGGNSMIDNKTLESILYLSRLKVTDEEKEHFRSQIGSILDYFNLLNNYDTEGIDPDIGEAVQVGDLRDDVPERGFSPGEVESFAVQFTDHYFTVPKILDDFLEYREEE